MSHPTVPTSTIDCIAHNTPLTVAEKTLASKAAILLILAAGLFAHWPGLISDSVMWDDWIILAWITQARPDWMFQFYHNYGVTPFFLALIPFVTFAQTTVVSVLSAKIIYFASILLNSVLIFWISKKIAHGNWVFATLAGISAVCFPALSGEGFHLTMMIYGFTLPLFLTGLFLFITITSSTPKTKRMFVIRSLALLCFFLSFSLNSLLILFYALVPAVFYASLQDIHLNFEALFVKAKTFLICHLDFLALPLIFWFLKEIFMPRIGLYARYNAMGFDWIGIFQAYERLIGDILQTVLFVPLSIPYVPWVAGLIFLVVVLGSQSFLKRLQSLEVLNRQYRQWIIIFFLGLIALFAAALPYYMVGRRSFSAFGYMSRDNITFPLPVAWITAALFCLFLKPLLHFPNQQTHALKLLSSRVVLGIFVALMVAQSISNWRNHADWQAHYAYYRSANEKLVKDERVNRASIIQLNDQLPGERTLKTLKYPTSIWTEILSAAFQKTERLVIPFPPANGQYFTLSEIKQRVRETEVDFMLGDIKLDGQQIRLTIEPGVNVRDPILLALAYWRARFFAPTEMPILLDSLTQIRSEVRFVNEY